LISTWKYNPQLHRATRRAAYRRLWEKPLLTEQSFRSLARTQIVFATGGLLCAAAGQAIAPRAFSPLAYTLSGGFLAFVLYAGKELRRGTRRGIFLSLVAQVSQILHLSFSAFGVLFLAGPFVELGASPSIVLVSAGAGAVAFVAPTSATTPMPGARLELHFGFLLDTSASHPAIAIGVNFVALVFALRLWRLWSETRNTPSKEMVDGLSAP